MRDKALRRARIAAASHYLAHMFVAVPAPSGVPPSPAAAAGWFSRTTWGLIALGSWLVTVALGLTQDSAQDSAKDLVQHSAQVRRAPVLIVGAHVVLATATILFAVLAAIGTG